MNEEFLSIKEAAKILGVSTLTLRNWDKSGKFSAKRHPMNNYRVYENKDILALIEQIKLGQFNIKTRKNQVRKLEVKHIDD